MRNNNIVLYSLWTSQLLETKFCLDNIHWTQSDHLQIRVNKYGDGIWKTPVWVKGLHFCDFCCVSAYAGKCGWLWSVRTCIEWGRYKKTVKHASISFLNTFTTSGIPSNPGKHFPAPFKTMMHAKAKLGISQVTGQTETCFLSPAVFPLHCSCTACYQSRQWSQLFFNYLDPCGDGRRANPQDSESLLGCLCTFGGLFTAGKPRVILKD